MKLPFVRCVGIIWVGLLCLAGRGSGAELGGSTAAKSSPALPGVAPGSQLTPPEPALPGTKSPAETFRELLRLSPVERAEALADRTEHNRKYLEARLREYEAMPAGQRELRLKQLDLTYHLEPLMKMPPSRRVDRLKFVPPDLRPVIEERLRQWDLLPPEVQQGVLEHETTSNYFLRVRADDPAGPNAVVYATASSAQSRRIREHFHQFFGLPVKEQQKTLEVLPPQEREEMEKSLRTFANLPAEQRKICIDSFEKFSRMSKEQRDQFLKNAARWKAMSPRERETWRVLVSILPAQSGASLPPALPGAPEATSGVGIATVSNRSEAAK